MNKIEPLHDWEYRLLFLARGCSWNDVVEKFHQYTAEGMEQDPLLELVSAIAQSPYADQIYAGYSIYNLVISDTPDFQSVNGSLHIAHRPDARCFWFHHIAINGDQECVACSEPEAFQTFERFLRLKFLIGRPPDFGFDHPSCSSSHPPSIAPPSN